MAVSADPLNDTKDLAKRLKVTFPLLSDPELRVIRSYGLRQKGKEIATPAVFVIRPDGTIAWRHISDTISDRPDVDVLIRAVRRANGSSRESS